jgi:hypothetical protein
MQETIETKLLAYYSADSIKSLKRKDPTKRMYPSSKKQRILRDELGIPLEAWDNFPLFLATKTIPTQTPTTQDQNKKKSDTRSKK